MLLALLWPDPCDPHCPEEFKIKARELLAPLPGKVGTTDEDLRKALLKFIGDFANWDRSADPVYLEVSRALVKTAHLPALSDTQAGGRQAVYEPPLVVDPFAGGGSIPLEALRVGCDAFASDLNPVACLILKVMLEDIPRHGPALAEELRKVGKEIKAAAEKELAEFYPADPDGARPIAYLWARTIRCEAPNCGAEIPLMRSFWLCKKPNRKRALRYKVICAGGEPPGVEFEIFEPKSDKEVSNGTVTRAKATCLCCNTVLPPERVRAQLTEQKGGADTMFDENGNRIGGARLSAVVTLEPGTQGRKYRMPVKADYKAVWKSRIKLQRIAEEKLINGLSPVPEELLPPHNTNCFRIPNYGMRQWKDVFTSRQRLALTMLSRGVRDLAKSEDFKSKYFLDCIALVVSRCSDFNASLNIWAIDGEFVAHVFGRQALSMVWDFCEVMPLTTESGGFDGALNWVIRVIEKIAESKLTKGQTQLADACSSPLPDEVVATWFTDPPYYDAVGYAELSDFFFIWLKRSLMGHPSMRDPFDSKNPLVPKLLECVQDENYFSVDGNPKDKKFFEKTMSQAFIEGRRVTNGNGIGCVVFAHKTTEGWEALLSGMTKAGWTITGSWPIATERPGRLRSQDSAALATSVHLVCRPRPDNAPVGDWGDVLKELPKRVGDWMERLQSEGIRGADLVFACIGPALEIFSRYSKVETADGKEVSLADYLEKVWEVVGRLALEQVLGTADAQARNGAAGAIEEDARLTALFLWTLQSTNGDPSPQPSPNGRGNDELEDQSDDDDDNEKPVSGSKPKGFSLIFDVARRFAQPLGIHLPEWEGRIIETKKGVVRLLSVSERAEQLFGKEGTRAAADRIELSPEGKVQLSLFPEYEESLAPKIKGRGRYHLKTSGIDITEEALHARREATTLDRVHAAMLLQSSGKTNALRALLKSEQDRGSDFLRLANALSALYPKNSEEKRLLDAMLLAMPR
jgi:adenine-specific DNA methylase